MFIIPHYDPTNLPYLIRFLRSIGIKYRKARYSDELIYVIPRSEFYNMYKNYCQHFHYPTYNEKIFKEYLIQKETGITYVKSHGVRSYRFEKDNFEKALTHFSPYFFTETEE
jgi:hypothetical protein